MSKENEQPSDIYPTYGVHNPPKYSPCATPDCIYRRQSGEPSNPLYPEYWSAKWVMYTVFNKYQDNPPPYDGRPPDTLKPGEDYRVSYGATYYDSTWRGPNGEEGAMMEHYEEWSLPIFPRDNHYTSSFISLGNTAYFLTYDKDRPPDLPPICVFSTLNHPPRRDFVKHLPYSKGDSQRIDGIQAYSFWASHAPNKPPFQVGASPDQTANGGVLFGYSFHSERTPDAYDKDAPPYRHPHSFYFSGFPQTPPDAPIVSQNYLEFAMVQPDPAETWDLVAKFADGKPIPHRNLFDGLSMRPKGSRRARPQTPSWAGRLL